MSCRDTSYVSTLLLLSMRTRTTFGAYRSTYVLTYVLRVLLETCVMLRATDALRTVYVAAYCTAVHVVIHLMSYRTNLCRTVTQLMLLGHVPRHNLCC
jgi:hypothetical protein